MVIINLKVLQQQFLNALDDPNLADTALLVYQKSMQGNLSGVLKATFPVCCRLVGDDFFRQLAKGYIAKTTHSQPDITDYGLGFPSFVADELPVHQLSYLADVAKLEWACHHALNGPYASSLEMAALAAVPVEEQPRLTFGLSKQSTLIHSSYPILRIWQVNQVDDAEDQTIDLGEGEVYLLVHVRHKSLCMTPLTIETFKMLTYFAAGMTFEAVCERANEEYPSLDIPHLFADCVKQQFLVSFKLS